MTLVQEEPKSIKLGTTDIKKVYLGSTQVRPKPMPAGIYHNATLGLISLSSDGQNWVTIADKNLGATQVYNSGNTLSQANCGNFYQRGNNYGFPYDYTQITNTSNDYVNTSGYGPNNYYSSNVFITRGWCWDTYNGTRNYNLWGGTTGTYAAMRGPCNAGYHVPSSTDLTNFISILSSLGVQASQQSSLLKIPYDGRLYWNPISRDSTEYFFFWSATANNNMVESYGLSGRNINLAFSGGYYTNNAQHIRPFKNEAVQPDSSRTKLYPLA